MLMNENNLVPNSKRTPMERRENARKAGLASGKARKERSNLRSALKELLAAKSESPKDPKKQVTGAEMLALTLFDKAMQGNVNAFKLLAEITGEYKQEIQAEIKGDIKSDMQERQMTPQEAAEFLRELEKHI